jgi:glycosyltransferase involved in cell wall biosynthesis
MVVRDEEHNLPRCLKATQDVVDERLVVDTGSTDRTKAIAASFGAKVFEFPWCDSFSAARNEAIKHATGDWILSLDADKWLNPENLEKFRRLRADLTDVNIGYFMNVNVQQTLNGNANLVPQLRLFRNHPGHRWQYRVHEQIVPALEAAGAEFKLSAPIISHDGYGDPRLALRKLERNLRLVELDLRERPDDPYVLFNVGSSYCSLNRPAEALPPLLRSLQNVGAGFAVSQRAYCLISRCYSQIGQFDEALRWCLDGRKSYADDVELLFLEAETTGMVRKRACFKACRINHPRLLRALGRLRGRGRNSLFCTWRKSVTQKQ